MAEIYRCKFSGKTDIQAMAELARLYPADNLHVVDLPYRLSSWALDIPENIGLWTKADDRLVGWAILQTPFWTIDYVYQPAGGKELHNKILAWADQQADAMRETPTGHSLCSVAPSGF